MLKNKAENKQVNKQKQLNEIKENKCISDVQANINVRLMEMMKIPQDLRNREEDSS